MSSDRKMIWQYRFRQQDQFFLQPIAVAIVCAVFIVLILIMGIMDSQRSNRILVGFMQNQALSIIGVIQRLSQENLSNLVQAFQRDRERSFVPLKDTAFSPQKMLTTALADLGREIDEAWKADQISDSSLQKFAAEKGLWMVAVMNKQGRVVYQSRSLLMDQRVQRSTVKIKETQQETAIGLLTQLVTQLDFHRQSLLPGTNGRNEANVNDRDIPGELIQALNKLNIGFVALKRKDGSGTILIALDRDGLRYWGTKVSIEKALEKLGEGQGQGLVYIVVMDRQGTILDATGRVPEKWREADMHLSEILSGKRTIESRKVIYQGRNLLDMAIPFVLNDKIAGVVRIGLERESMDRILAENRRNMVIFSILIVLIALLAMWLLFHNQNRHLAGIVEMERRLDKAERLSALGQLAAGVAHEIRNPLNAVSMASQRLKRDFVPADEDKAREFQSLAGVIRDEIRRLNGIIEEFLTFSKSRRLEFHDYPVTDVLQKIVNLIREEATAKNIDIRTHWSTEGAIIPMDMDKLQQALLNIIKNAMESIDGKGVIDITVTQKTKDKISIKVSDTGCGMTSNEVERIFSPEYTTKEKGLGLGLPLAHEIVRGHSGEILVFSEQGSGTTFEIILPAEKVHDKSFKGEGLRGKASI
ncbi:MAG: ATP-binding protein [Deltaproteobacteria bacterium]|nr:ATP-binding protein [Deltaproteobacteria bacterium]